MEDATRDDLCNALADLYGYAPTDFDGQTTPEVWDYLTNKQQGEVQAYLTGA